MDSQCIFYIKHVHIIANRIVITIQLELKSVLQT